MRPFGGGGGSAQHGACDDDGGRCGEVQELIIIHACVQLEHILQQITDNYGNTHKFNLGTFTPLHNDRILFSYVQRVLYHTRNLKSTSAVSLYFAISLPRISLCSSSLTMRNTDMYSGTAISRGNRPLNRYRGCSSRAILTIICSGLLEPVYKCIET